MAEDMTYEPAQTVAQLAARVQELERALAQADGNMIALAERNAELAAAVESMRETILSARVENDELSARVKHWHMISDNIARDEEIARAKLNAVPEYTFACLQAKERGEVSVWPSLDEWLEMGEPDGDGYDASLILAAIDEDGDE